MQKNNKMSARAISTWKIFRIVLLGLLTYVVLIALLIWNDYQYHCIHIFNPAENAWYNEGFKLNQKDHCDRLLSLSTQVTAFITVSGLILSSFLIIERRLLISGRFYYKKKLVFGLLFFVAFLISIELISRDYHYSAECSFMKSDEYEQLDYLYKRQMCNEYTDLGLYTSPELHLAPNQHFTHYNINSHGLRGPEFNKIKDHTTYRIFVVGGDNIFGLASTSDDTTIPGYLQKKFYEEKGSIKVEVINAGVPNAFSLTETQLVKNHISGYEPDLIIIYTGFDDMNLSYEYSSNEDLFNKGITTKLLERIKFHLPFYKTMDVFPKVLAFVKSFSDGNIFETGSQKISLGYKSEIQLPNISDKLSIWKNRLEDICNLGRQKGFETVVILHPFVGTGNKSLSSYEYEEVKIQRIVAPDQLQIYQMYADKLKEFSNCTSTVDLRNAFDKINDSVYMPFNVVYVGDKGNKIIADEIYEIIKPIMHKNILTRSSES